MERALQRGLSSLGKERARITELMIRSRVATSLHLRQRRFAGVILAVFLLAGIGLSKTTPKHSSSRHLKSPCHSRKNAKLKKVAHGQRTIDDERSHEIQIALIHEHYLCGEPTGVWDQETRDALVRYQADNGWQTKVTPDSRALIKLGLGPDHKGLLNPDTAAIPSAHEPGLHQDTQPGGPAQPPPPPAKSQTSSVLPQPHFQPDGFGVMAPPVSRSGQISLVHPVLERSASAVTAGRR